LILELRVRVVQPFPIVKFLFDLSAENSVARGGGLQIITDNTGRANIADAII